jgi:hypothetical protein
MTDGGLANRILASGFLGRVTARARTRQDWARIGLSVRGPLLTLVLIIIFDQMVRRGVPFAHPFPFLLVSVVYSGYSGGLRPALVSGLLTLLYAVFFLREPGTIIRYAPENAYTLFALVIALFRHRETLSPDAYASLRW